MLEPVEYGYDELGRASTMTHQSWVEPIEQYMRLSNAFRPETPDTWRESGGRTPLVA